MPWLWGRGRNTDEEGDEDEEEYSDEEYTDDEDDEYESDEESYTDEEEEDGVDEQVVHEEKKEPEEGDQQQSNSDDHAVRTESKSREKTTTKKAEPAASKTATNNGEMKNGKAKSGANIATYAQEFDDHEEDVLLAHDEEAELERIESNIPDQVLGNRGRAPSALTLGEEEDELSHESNVSGDLDRSNHSEVSNENEHVTTLAEKQSLLVLAAEHDRVDILNSILSDADAEIKDQLLHGGIPPLHIAVLHGSTNTATCLLRLGADPSVRPNVEEIEQDQDPKAHVDVPKQIDGITAWELAFDKKKSVVPKAKRQGIMNAFSAEALRCMGSDEGPRLQQLLDAGMPADMAIMGDKSLYDWAVELGAPQCEEVLRPAQAAKHEKDIHTNQAWIPEAAPLSGGKSAVLDRPGSEESVSQLVRQLEELESLAKALSTCLDSLAEEVSVSHGLLLMGGGASALASHVRSLKTIKEQKMEELTRYQDSFENTEDEFEYWVSQAGPKGQAIAAEETPVIQQGPLGARKHIPQTRFKSVEEERQYRETLHEKIASTNDKIRKFRVSIAELSEENDRNIQEVEKRGLTGGINLVRGLKDEIREIEFTLEEIKVADAVYRAKIEKIQALVNSGELNAANSGEENSMTDTSRASTEHHFNHAHANGDASRSLPNGASSDSFSDVASDRSAVSNDDNEGMKPSEKIATGQSTALALRREGSGPGLFPLSLWQILLRIIGLRDDLPPPRRQTASPPSNSQPAMIV